MKIQEDGYRGVLSITVDADGVPQRGLRIVCTVAGNVALKFADDTTDIMPIEVGLTVLPYAVKTVLATGTTATATYKHLV